jgi:hypothetical protein
MSGRGRKNSVLLFPEAACTIAQKCRDWKNWGTPISPHDSSSPASAAICLRLKPAIHEARGGHGVNHDAYRAGLKIIPDPNEKYDPWGNVRRSQR